MLKQLWAPWRLAHIAAAKQPGAEDPCFICRGLAADDDRANLIVLRTFLCASCCSTASVQQRPSARRAARP